MSAISFERLSGSVYLGLNVLGQARFAFRPRVGVLRAQARRVRRMADYAYRHVPYNRETMDRMCLRPLNFRSAEDLARLPLIERKHFLEAPEQFMPRAGSLSRCLTLRTGGSTGSPMTIHHDVRAVLQTMAHTERYRSVVSSVLGKRLRYRETLVLTDLSSNQRARAFSLDKTVLIRKFIPRKQLLRLADPPEKNILLIREWPWEVEAAKCRKGSPMKEFLHVRPPAVRGAPPKDAVS